MPIRYPAPLQPGDRIGITAPSSGVPEVLIPRLQFAISTLRTLGYEVTVGQCVVGEGIVSGTAEDRAAELTAMLTDPLIRAVVPPWGGDLAVELLPHLDFNEINRAEPTWLVGLSDISTLLLAITTLTGVATLHGQNLLDTPYRVPAPLLPWTAVATHPTGQPFSQGPSERHRALGADDWEAAPQVTEYTFDTPGTWRHAGDASDLQVRGRLLGGCIETISILAGTPFGDVAAFAHEHAPEGLMLYLEAAGDHNTIGIAQDLWRMRLAGWFTHVNAVLIARSDLPPAQGLTFETAVRSALGDLGIPLVIDVDCGHLPPHLTLANGALAHLTISAEHTSLVQSLGR